MNLKRYAKLGAAGLVLILVLSWWSGCWGRWRAKNPVQPPVPERVDDGAKVTPEAPTVQTPIAPAVQQIDPKAMEAWLKKYGLKIVAQVAQTPAVGDSKTEDESEDEPAGPAYPLRLSEESFCQQPDAKGKCPPTSPSIDVTAFLPCADCEVDQVAVWRELEREPCPDQKVFAAPGRFRTFVGIGGVGGSVTDDAGDRVSFAEPAALLGGTFEGVRVGPVTLGGMGLAGVTQGGDVAGAVGLGISF